MGLPAYGGSPIRATSTVLYHTVNKKARRTERAFDNLHKKRYNKRIMKVFLIVLSAVVLLIALTAFICFYMAFYSPKRKPLGKDEYQIPDGEIYEPYRDVMVGWMKETRSMPCEKLSVRSNDGLVLRGKYYEYEKGESEKKWIYTVAGAGHGLSFMMDKDGYIRALNEAAGEYGKSVDICEK